MPYINKNRRKEYDKGIADIQLVLKYYNDEPGDLNYVLSRIVGRVWRNTPRYKTICIVIGTLVCVAFEFYRRVAGGHEDKAVKKNGDIKEYDDDDRSKVGDRPADKTLEAPALVNRDKGCEHWERYCYVCSNIANQQRR